MNQVLQVVKWAYSDSLKHMAFILALTAFIAFLMTLIAYPIQTIATLLIGFATWVLFTLFTEWS